MKTVIISGGAQGIGLATVKKFAKAGYRCFILDIQQAQETLENTQFFQCDLTDLSAIQQTVNKITQAYPQIDALVLNAGIHYSATLQETTLEAYDRVMNINFRSAFFLTQAVLPHMLTQKNGAIVFVGSDQTLVGKPHSAIYGASKAALGSLAKTTAIDYERYNIRANLVAVGTTDTPLYQQAVQRYCDQSGADPVNVHAQEANEQPLGRIGKPDEIAHLIYFLCSDEAAFITGGIYPIDGGYTAR